MRCVIISVIVIVKSKVTVKGTDNQRRDNENNR